MGNLNHSKPSMQTRVQERPEFHCNCGELGHCRSMKGKQGNKYYSEELKKTITKSLGCVGGKRTRNTDNYECASLRCINLIKGKRTGNKDLSEDVGLGCVKGKRSGNKNYSEYAGLACV